MQRVLAVSFAGLMLLGCGRSGEPSSAEQQGVSYLRCAEPYDDGKEESFSLPPLTVTRKGYDLAVRGVKSSIVTLGVLAGLAEPLPENTRNVADFFAAFKEAGAVAIAVPGGVGTTPEQVQGVLALLAKAPVPVLISPGAEENFDVVRTEIAKARARSPQLIDMSRVRRVSIGNLSLVSLPGYYKPFYLAAKERGCSYEKIDIDATLALLDKKSFQVLLSATPPRGAGPFAADRGRGDVNLGDPALTLALSKAGVRFGIFGHVFESGGHGAAADGMTQVQENTWHDSLFLQAGSADAVPVTLVGGGRVVGMAQIIEVSGTRVRFRTVLAAGATR